MDGGGGKKRGAAFLGDEFELGFDYDGAPVIRRSGGRMPSGGPVRGDGTLEAAAVTEVGQLVEGKGVFIGTWEPKDSDGNSLEEFNLFAAPEDLMDAEGRRLAATFNGAVKHVAALRDWHGHDGGDFRNDAALYAAMKEGRYKGEWFIPPVGVLKEHLYPNRNKGALAGTFTTASSGAGFAPWYWSCTENCWHPDHVWFVRFLDSFVDWVRKDNHSLSSRVVRAEPVAP